MADTTEPLPDDTQDPALDEDSFEFTLDDLNAVFTDDTAEDVDEPAATAAPTGDESEEPPSSSPDEAADEGGVEPQGHAGDDTPLEDSTDPERTAIAESAAAENGLVNIDGQMYRAEDVAQLIGYIENLSPEKQALLFGQPEPVVDPRTVLPPEDEIVDPRLAEYVQTNFSQIETKLDAVLAQQQAQQQLLAQQQQAELNAALDTARRGVAEAHGLSDAEAQRLLEIANQMPEAAAAVQNANLTADPVGAFRSALETTYWLTPEFRDRAIEDQVTTRAAELGVQASLDERRQLNQSLVGSGAAAPRAHAPKPSTPEEHTAAAIDLVRESLSNN